MDCCLTLNDGHISFFCRLKAALRRTDVRSADDFDEGEYRDASRSVGEHTYALVQCCSSGWAFPWGLRARLAEMLLRGVFDTLDEGAYIPVSGHWVWSACVYQRGGRRLELWVVQAAGSRQVARMLARAPGGPYGYAG